MSLIHTLDINTEPSQRLLEACATFGLAVRHTTTDTTRPTFTLEARALHAQLKPGDLVLIQGASGSGKSSLLDELARLATRNNHTVIRATTPPTTDPHTPHTPLIDLIDLPLADALRTLAHAGLADATMLSRSRYQLSEGERFRLRLAQALAASRASDRAPTTPTTLIIDEFASVLDRPTARCLCFALRRFLARQPLTVILATAHDDVRAWLSPDHLIQVSHRAIQRSTP